ncbi:hypothetical protein TNCV_2116801 [Trichonephila clavipes]|nr:hypothetical protein TNCV_2116801 [Trichonephila clavipes]
MKVCEALEERENRQSDLPCYVKGFQEWDEEDVETWMICDAEDYGFQMLNDDEIVISMQELFDPVDDETDEDEDNNNESSKDHQMLTCFLR